MDTNKDILGREAPWVTSNIRAKSTIKFDRNVFVPAYLPLRATGIREPMQKGVTPLYLQES